MILYVDENFEIAITKTLNDGYYQGYFRGAVSPRITKVKTSNIDYTKLQFMLDNQCAFFVDNLHDQSQELATYTRMAVSAFYRELEQDSRGLDMFVDLIKLGAL